MPWADRMDKLRKTFSFRKKKKKPRDTPETSKPQQWLEDEKKVRDGNCSFQVKYLGYIEVFESRGLHVCEEAIKALRKVSSQKRTQRAILYVSGDALRVADEISKGLIVDQTIEKVSFCAPDRNHEKGFAYICRDGATRRWMCHAFLAVKESGERLSHAVGCAFAICLEKKQKREKEAVQVTYSDNGTSFARMGSFRQATLTERLQDPQSAILAEPLPTTTTAEGTAPSSPANAIPRPHASASCIERQGSLRLFPKLQETTSPFKRDLSLRLTDLPSNIARLNHILANGDSITEEMSPVNEEDEDPRTPGHQQVGAVASDFARQLNLLSNNAAGGLPPHTTAAVVNSNPGSSSEPLDPFSAAPVNPATLRQQQKSPLNTTNTPPTNPFPVASPFHHHPSPQHAALYQHQQPQQHFGGQAVVRPIMTSSPFQQTPGLGNNAPNPWTQPHYNHQAYNQHHPSHNYPLTSTNAWVPPQAPVMHPSSLHMMAGTNSGWSTSINSSSGFGGTPPSSTSTNMGGATGGAFPPSSSGFDSTDPFDLAWTESKAGAVATGNGARHNPSGPSTNPFLPSSTGKASFEVKM